MRKFITKKIAYPLQDFCNKTSILSTHNFLRESQHWSESQLQDYQFAKFRKLLEHAYRNVPYYSDLFHSINLRPIDVKSFNDLYKIPILTKKTARKENHHLIARNLPGKHIHKGVTGGTTGPPLKLLRDPGDLTYTWAAFFRWYSWMGIEIGDPITKIWGSRTVLSMPFQQKVINSIKNWYYNRNVINSFQLNDDSIPKAINDLNQFRPALIRGYLSALIQLAEYMKDHHVNLEFEPKAISSTTETLMEPFRKMIEKQFGTKLYDQYGCGECNSIAFEAGDGLGLYIAAEHVKLEILDNSDAPESNKEGRIIFTNLDNYAMPFIRYENGDSGELAGEMSGKMFNLPLLKRVSGRTADTIILSDGSKVHGVFFTDILSELFYSNPDYIHRFQVFQQIAGEIEFRIESRNPVPEKYLILLDKALRRFFSKIAIKVMEDLPLDESGKFRYVISNIT